MKIILLMDNPSIPTGYASTCRLTAKELARRGHDVWAMAFNGGPPYDDMSEWYGIRVIPNHAIKRDRNAIYGDPHLVMEVNERINPDIFFLHNDAYRYAYAGVLPQHVLDKFVFWLPFEGDHKDELGLRLFSKFSATRFVTKYALDLHADDMIGKDIGHIPHAIDLEALFPCPTKMEAKAAKKMGLENKFVVARVDRHQPRKYWDRTLAAFAKFAKGKDDVFMLCKCNPRDITMWNSEEKKGVDLEAMAEGLGIRDKLFFDDFFFNTPALAAAFLHPADVFVTTTSAEGFGLTSAEAMACGVPVIHPDSPVLPETVAGGGFPCRVSSREYYSPMHVWHNLVDIDDVASKLEMAYGDWKSGGSVLREVGARGRAIAEDKYSPKVVYDQWAAVFSRVAEGRDLASIVTVLYNTGGSEQIGGDDGVAKFKESIEKYVSHPYEWVIVDNGSPRRGETRAWMEDAARSNPRIRLKYLDVNLGFAGGNNAGIATAKGKWVFLCNPDSEALDAGKLSLPADFVSMMIAKAKSDPAIGIVGMETNRRDDVLLGSMFHYFCNVLITRDCLGAIQLGDGKWLDESFWPSYYEDSLTKDRMIPIKSGDSVDVVSMEKLFEMGSKRTRFDGKEESLLRGIETLAVDNRSPAAGLDIDNLPEWWTKRFLSSIEQVVYNNFKTTKKWRTAARNAGLLTRQSQGGISHSIRKRIARSAREDASAQWVPIKRVVRHDSSKQIVRVDSRFGQTECTIDHSLMIWDGTSIRASSPNEIRGGVPCSVTCPIDVPLHFGFDTGIQGDLIDGDFAYFKNIHGENYGFPIQINFDSPIAEALFAVMGEYAAEGSTSGNVVSICGTDQQAINEATRLFSVLVGRNLKYHEYEIGDDIHFIRGREAVSSYDKIYRVQVVNSTIAEFFVQHGGKGAYNKKIPSFVFTAPKRLKEIFLRHMFRGDAYTFDADSNFSTKYDKTYREEAFRFGSTSLALASGTCLLLASIGRRFSVYYNDEKHFYGVDHVHFRRNLRSPNVKVTPINYSGCVYDLEVEKHHTFVDAMGLLVVHNSDFTMRAMGKGFKIADENVAFWHKSGGTNRFAIEGGKDGPHVRPLLEAIDILATCNPGMADWPRKRGELLSGGMQGLIAGNIAHLNSKWGPAARARIKVLWETHIGAAVGFSQIAEGLIPELHRLGFDVYVNDWNGGAKTTDPLIKSLIEKTRKAKEEGSLDGAISIVCWLMETFLSVESSYKVGVSFCESTRVRPSYLQACNGMDRILTFSEFCRGVQRASGYASPIHVIPPGVNPLYLEHRQRPQSGKFTFLCVGVSQERKDTHRLVEAFCSLFPKGAVSPPGVGPGFPVKCDDVELVVKSNVFGDLEWIKREGFDKKANIRAIFTGDSEKAERPDMSAEEMRDLYFSSDCLIHPSHGEGIGYPLLEGAATGLPVIFTNWSSPAEYFNEGNSYPLRLDARQPMSPAYTGHGGAHGENGEWANASIEHLRQLMLEVIRKRAESQAKGKAAHEHVKRNFTWQESARRLVPLLFEWDEDRKKKQARGEFDPATFAKPSMDPVRRGDRVCIDVVTRDRHPYLATLLVSLLSQTFKDWDIFVQIDDVDESVLVDHQIMSLMNRLGDEGHNWRVIRSHRQGPHIAHDRTLQMARDCPHCKYKLVCRVDDDIFLRPDYLENLFATFVADDKCEIGAVAGVYPFPTRPKAEQTAPPGFETNIDYAGKISHNVPWPYICFYPDDTPPREMEHLYSSFMYRIEVATAIGGYCRLYSQIGHREESDFSHRFHLAGYKLLVQPSAIGFHFAAPGGGIRSASIIDKDALAHSDHKIYERRLTKWHKRMADRKPPAARPKVACVVNCGADAEVSRQAVARFSQIADDLYLTAKADPGIPGVKFASTSAADTTMLATSLLADGDHEFVMTVSDTMVFRGDPRTLLDDGHDDYVFEVYKSYSGGPGGKLLGPEVRNQCLVTRKGVRAPSLERTLYSDMIVIDDVGLPPIGDKSLLGNPLVSPSDMGSSEWRKICVHQFPEGDLVPPRYIDVKPASFHGVSIIIPTAGRLMLLKKCIASIYALTTTPFEIVVVDNGSSDGTAEYLEAESRRKANLRVLRQPVNLGYQRAINIGVAASRGKHVLLFNDDAWVESVEPDGRDWLGVYVDELAADPKLGIIGPHGDMSPSLGQDMLFFWCVMMRKETWDDVGPLDDVTFRNYGGDDDYCHRLRDKGYGIKLRLTKLRHLMTCVPEAEKKPEIEQSRIKLKEKYPS